MLKWLRNLLTKRKQLPRDISPEQVASADRNIQEICAQAFNAPPGHCILGHVDDEGKLHTEEVKVK